MILTSGRFTDILFEVVPRDIVTNAHRTEARSFIGMNKVGDIIAPYRHPIPLSHNGRGVRILPPHHPHVFPLFSFARNAISGLK